MLRRDFISKTIDQMVNSLTDLLRVDPVLPEKFIHDFDELLKNYFKINSDQMEILLEEDEERDMIFLDHKLKNLQIRLFTTAGFTFIETQNLDKAKVCISLINRIENQHANVFEFPTPESIKIQSELTKLKQALTEVTV